MKLILKLEKGMPIEEFLERYVEKQKVIDYLRDKRYLYVIQSHADKPTGVLKLGIGHNPGRLIEYTHHYGRFGSSQCAGVNIFFLIVTTYKRHVEKKKTKIVRLETALKRYYKDRIKQVNRGDERLIIPPKELMDKILDEEKHHKDARAHVRYAGPTPVEDSDDEAKPVPTPSKRITRSQTSKLGRLKKTQQINPDNILNSKRISSQRSDLQYAKQLQAMYDAEDSESE